MNATWTQLPPSLLSPHQLTIQGPFCNSHCSFLRFTSKESHSNFDQSGYSLQTHNRSKVHPQGLISTSAFDADLSRGPIQPSTTTDDLTFQLRRTILHWKSLPVVEDVVAVEERATRCCGWQSPEESWSWQGLSSSLLLVLKPSLW